MTVNLVQINLQKSKQALNNFYSFLVRNPNTLGIVQEPYSYHGKIPKNREISIFGNQAGRAVLFAPKHIPIFACSEMCFEDHTVVLLKTEKVTQFISSIYLDQEIDCITPELVKICNFFRDNNVNAIIGMDSNSWSPFWGSKSSNPRGI